MSAAMPATVTPNARELAAMLRSARGLQENSQTLSVLMASPRLARAVLVLFLVGATIAGTHFSGGRSREVLRDSARDFAIFRHNAARRPSFSPAGERVRSLESPEEDGMRSLRALAASSVGVGSIMAAGISGSAFAQDAVQWRIEDGGNGHWYAFTESVYGSWKECRIAAETRGATLAQLKTAALQNFIVALAHAKGVFGDYWLGASQQQGSEEPSGGWSWLDGEPLSFDAWGAVSAGTGSPPSPNDWPTSAPGDEDFLEICFRPGVVSPVGSWDDQGAFPNPSLIEWSADCNADGIVDYGQIRVGELADTNANNIPDCCESAAECPDSTPAVQWSTQNGGNGHWYSLRVDPLVPIEHFNPRCEAIGGHLASIEGPSEHAFVLQLMVTQGWLGIAGWPAIGLQRSSDSAPWQWVTGEATTYLPWAPGEPGAGGRFAQLWGVGQTPNLTWSANGNSFISVGVIEWSADCNADGIVDYGQIRAGELADTNANNIPDCCEAAEGCNPCLADIDESGAVNAVDLAAILSNWGTNAGKYPRADINADGIVSAPDLAEVLGAWGPCP
jgi:hypothetical protein